MNFLVESLGPALWRASWQAGLLAVIVAGVLWCLGERAAPRWRYLLWSVVLLRFLLPITPAAPWSIFQVISESGTAGTPPEPSAVPEPRQPQTTRPGAVAKASSETTSNPRVVEPARSIPPRSPRIETPFDAPRPLKQHNDPPVTKPATTPSASTTVGTQFSWRSILTALWLAGVIVFAARFFHSARLLRRRLARCRPVTDESLLEDLRLTAARIGLRGTPRLIVSPESMSPSLTGLWRPRLILPESVLTGLSRDQIVRILAHELAHLKRGDLWMNWLLLAAGALHWFNPLAWWTVRRLREERESTCDEIALAGLCPSERHRYANTILELSASLAPNSLVPGMIGFFSPKRSLSRRLRRLARAPRVRPLRPWLMFVMCAFLAVAGLTDAGSPDESEKGASGSSQNRTDPENADERQGDETESAPTSGPAIANEKSDADQHQRLVITATKDATGEPLRHLKIRFHGRIAGQRYDRRIETDKHGKADITWKSGARVNNLWMTCQKEGFVPIHYTWRSDRRAIRMPDTLELRFHRGQTIGGIVRDPNDRLIEGAKVTITMPIDWPDLANHVFTAATLTTDTAGRWQWKGAPEDLGRPSIRVTHSTHLKEWAEVAPGLETVTVLKRGTELTGRVVDTDGNPVTGARVIEGFDDWGGHVTARTDSDGRFALKNCEFGKSAVTVQADGHCPAVQSLTIGEENKPLEFRLTDGNTLRIKVVDASGEPIEGVLVAPDEWRGYHTLSNRMRTDQDGRVAWNGAPVDAVKYSILKKGYMSRRDHVLTASSREHVVTLNPKLVIRGKVTDAASGEAIPEFKIRVGHDYTGRDTYWSRDEGVSYTDGAYRFQFEEPINGGYLLQVIAPGYVPATSRSFKPDEGSVTFDFALKPGDGPSGIVRDSEGSPVEDASVGLATVESRASLEGGYFDRGQNSANVVKTDAKGQFTFPPQGDERFLLIALHDSGFAEVTQKQLEKSNEITLKPWGRIEGRVMLGKKPDANRNVAFLPERPDRKGMYVFSYGYEIQTDEQGKFQFDRAIPRQGTVSRVIVTEFLDSWQHATGWQQPVEIEPRKTANITIGGTGRPVVGRVVLDREPDVEIDWTVNEPATIERWNPEENSRMDDYFRCLGPIAKNGRFEIPDVPPGDYRLSIPVNNPPAPNSCGAGTAIGRATLEFTMPSLDESESDEPLDLGRITAELFDTLEPGELAPDFVAKSLQGEPVRLRELHGKLVLLDFWASWCAPCLAEMPTLKTIQKEHGNNERFALLSVSCDNAIEAPQEYVSANDLSWKHAHVSGMSNELVKDYTVRALPGTFLIGPGGVVIAKNLRGDELERAVAAALKNETLFEDVAKQERPSRFPVTRFEPTPVPELSEEPAVVVLDNCDPSFRGEQPYTDGLRWLSTDGDELRVQRGFNNCQTIGGMHGVAIDPRRGRVYIREIVNDRVLAFDRNGRKRWRIDGVDAGALAVDPKTGHIWCITGSNLNEGETVIFDKDGNEIAAFPVRGVDIAYDPNSDAFWLVGKEILKLDRTGKIVFRKPVEGWCCVSISVDPRTGAVWFIERDHPDVAKSRNRLWKLNADGGVAVNRDLGLPNIFALEFDPRAGQVWVATLDAGLMRFSADGTPPETIDIKAYNLAIAEDGLWVATEEAVLKLDRSGEIVARGSFGQPSRQAWIATFASTTKP